MTITATGSRLVRGIQQSVQVQVQEVASPAEVPLPEVAKNTDLDSVRGFNMALVFETEDVDMDGPDGSILHHLDRASVDRSNVC